MNCTTLVCTKFGHRQGTSFGVAAHRFFTPTRTVHGATRGACMNVLAGASLSLALLLAGTAPAHADNYAVGSGTGCTHSDLRPALKDAATTPGFHWIKVAKPTDTSLSYSWPLSNAATVIVDPVADIVIIGGFASCTATEPSGYSTLSYFDTSASSPDRNRRLLTVTNDTSNSRHTLTLTHLHLDGTSTPPNDGFKHFPHGAISIEGNLALVLDEDAKISHFEDFSGGGGVELIGYESTPVATEKRPKLRMANGAEIDHNRADNGGGIYASDALVVLDGGSVRNNEASAKGGGIYIRDQSDSPDVYELVLRQGVGGATNSISENDARNNTDVDETGFGGGVYAYNADIYSYPTDTGSEHRFRGNKANMGGAMFVEGKAAPSGGPYAAVRIHDTEFYYNSAEAYGGALYSKDAVDWKLYSSHTRTQDISSTYKTGPSTSFIYNQAFGNTFAGPLGGAAVFITNTRDDGMSRGIMRFHRVWFWSNITDGGAIVAADADSELEFYRSIFDSNSFLGTDTDHNAVIWMGNGKNMRATYSTFINNGYNLGDYVFAGKVADGETATYNLQGSILWNPDLAAAVGVDVGIGGVAGTIETVTYGCMVSKYLLHDSYGVANWSGASFRLDDHYRPGALSLAIDHCDEFAVTPEPDIYLVSSPYDVPGVAARSPGSYYPPNTWDLGAVELTGVIFANAFGTRPSN